MKDPTGKNPLSHTVFTVCDTMNTVCSHSDNGFHSVVLLAHTEEANFIVWPHCVHIVILAFTVTTLCICSNLTLCSHGAHTVCDSGFFPVGQCLNRGATIVTNQGIMPVGAENQGKRGNVNRETEINPTEDPWKGWKKSRIHEPKRAPNSQLQLTEFRQTWK